MAEQTKTHWKKLQNPDYLGAYALENGKDLIATIKTVGLEMIIGADGKKEECTVIHFLEDKIKPMILNATNAKTITKLYKTPFIEEWAGRKIQLYSESVKAFGDVVEALRIRAFVPKVEVNMTVCADCNQPIKPFGDKSAAWLAKYTQDNYGKPLCSVCATKAAEDKTADDKQERATTAALDELIGNENENETEKTE